jgi:hypothetical protein
MVEYTKSALQDLARQEALRAGVDPELFLRLVNQESRFNPRAVSSAGAQGLAQLMPGTAADLGVEDPFDPVQNLRGGAQYLRKRLDQFQDPKLALAAYNAGAGNVRKYGGIPPFAETEKYVQIVGGDYEGSGYAPEAGAETRTDEARRAQYGLGDRDPGSAAQVLDAYQSGMISDEEFRQFMADQAQEDIDVGAAMSAMEALGATEAPPAPTAMSLPMRLSPGRASATPGAQAIGRFGLESLLGGNPLLGIR